MTIDQAAFKAYDIRGLYPEQLDEEGAELRGRRLRRRHRRDADRRRPRRAPVVALDRGRLRGGRALGRRRRRRAGAVRHRDALLRRRRGRLRRRRLHHGQPQPAPVHRREDGQRRRRAAVRATPASAEVGRVALAGPPRAATPGTRSRDEGLLDRFVERCLGFVDPDAIRGLRVVFDSANGMSGVYLPPVLERLDIDAVPYFIDPDGRFPNHEPNPLLPENREFIIGKVREDSADLGIAFDGDADRCFFIDDTGEFVPGDFLTALLARHILARTGPGGRDLRPARLVGGARHHHRRRRHAGHVPRRPRLHQDAACARSTRSSPARSAATTTSATSPTRTAA